MPGPAEPQISVRAGAAEPAAMALSPGQPIGPLSIGRLGTWRIVAAGVLEEHGFLYFNGTDLFLQSTDPNSPLLADGAPIPGEWTAIYAPCEIALGGARLWFGSPQATTASMRPAAPPGPPRRAPQAGAAPPAHEPPRFAPRVQGNDDEESTRVAPIEELAAIRAAKGLGPGLRRDPPSTTQKSAGVSAIEAAALAGAPPPATSFGVPLGTPSFGPTPFVTGPDGNPAGPLGPGPTPPVSMPFPDPGAPPAKPSWIAARWREASGPKKAQVILMPVLIWAVWVIFTDKPPPPAPAKPSASASAQPSAGAPSSAAPAEPPPVTPAPSGSASARPASSTAPSSSPATPGPKTPQREAADAVAAGAFDRAATLYAELARSHPDVPAYTEAARIMKAKAGKR